VAAKLLGSYIRGREKNVGLRLPPEQILEVSFINGQKKPLQEVFPAFLHSLGVCSTRYTSFKKFPGVVATLTF